VGKSPCLPDHCVDFYVPRIKIYYLNERGVIDPPQVGKKPARAPAHARLPESRMAMKLKIEDLTPLHYLLSAFIFYALMLHIIIGSYLVDVKGRMQHLYAARRIIR